MELKLSNHNSLSIWHYLLIVPYGIETKKYDSLYSYTLLLIVPYGIETFKLEPIVLTLISFNRTLWN